MSVLTITVDTRFLTLKSNNFFLKLSFSRRIIGQFAFFQGLHWILLTTSILWCLDTHVERDLSLFKGGKELIGYFGVQILTFTALRTAPQSQVLRLFNLFHLDVAETINIRMFLEENLSVFSAMGVNIH